MARPTVAIRAGLPVVDAAADRDASLGFGFGIIIALPAMRLDGFYYALLTLGVVELCRVYVVQSREFGSATGGLYGAPSYLPAGLGRPEIAAGILRIACRHDGCAVRLSLRRWQAAGPGAADGAGKERGFRGSLRGRLFRDRVTVFLLSSTALGFIGGFYATHFGGASPNLILVRHPAAVAGHDGDRRHRALRGRCRRHAIVVFVDRVLIDLGPLRYVIIGTLMLAVVLFLRGGLFGIKAQFRELARQEEERTSRLPSGERWRDATRGSNRN